MVSICFVLLLVDQSAAFHFRPAAEYTSSSQVLALLSAPVAVTDCSSQIWVQTEKISQPLAAQVQTMSGSCTEVLIVELGKDVNGSMRYGPELHDCSRVVPSLALRLQNTGLSSVSKVALLRSTTARDATAPASIRHCGSRDANANLCPPC